RDGWCEVFARWCDHPDAAPGPAAALTLARALAERGAHAEAERRLAPTLAADPPLEEAWRLQASLREAAGDGAGAAAAWTRAAACARGREAAEAELRAAGWLEAAAPADALAALERAVTAAPDLARAHAALARLAERCGELARAVAAAGRALA